MRTAKSSLYIPNLAVRLIAPALKLSVNAQFLGGGCGSVGVDVWVAKESPQPPETSTNAQFWGCGVVGRHREPAATHR